MLGVNAAVTDLQLEHSLLGILAHIWDGSASHEVEQRQDESCTLAQDVVGFTAVSAEVAVVRAVAPPHGLDHGGAQLHRGWEGLGVTAWKGIHRFQVCLGEHTRYLVSWCFATGQKRPAHAGWIAKNPAIWNMV